MSASLFAGLGTLQTRYDNVDKEVTKHFGHFLGKAPKQASDKKIKLLKELADSCKT